MDKLSKSSIEWALTHIKRFGDTDIFLVPFEFDAIAHDWIRIRKEIEEYDLNTYEIRPSRMFLIPKSQLGFRVSVQLDPIDAIIYVAMVHEISENLENSRIPRERRIACSYRLNITSEGQFFDIKSGWNDYQDHSIEIIKDRGVSNVLTLDIADFYNQISLHRINNAIELAGINEERARNIENFLLNITKGHSRGIPVGPSPSIILAEICLNDIDNFLIRNGYTHTRYVDDFRIFGKDEIELKRALHDISNFLYTSHRLTLQTHKTHLYDADYFLGKILNDPEKVENRKLTSRINSAIQELIQANIMDQMYGQFEEPDIDFDEVFIDINQRKIVLDILNDLIKKEICSNSPKLGLIVYVLRRATRIRTNIIQSDLLDNLNILLPIFRDVSKYLFRTTQNKTRHRVLERIINFYNNGDHTYIPYILNWIAWLFIHIGIGEYESEICNIFEKIQPILGIRPYAIFAKTNNYYEWVRIQKETWSNNRPFGRRAIIWSSSCLSQDEKRHWLARIENSGDTLDKAVAHLAMQ